MSVVYHTSAENFSRDVLSSPVPVLVDFYADWCGPCRMLAPTLDKLAVEFSGKARIVKVNVDKEPELATQYRVSSIPALMF
ncbi:MAG: thioredoxin, partial [Planctomycetota bacterium]